MKTTFAVIVLAAAVLVGCAHPGTSYGFSFPTFDKQEWTMVSPANRDEQAVKCLYVNENTGAVIGVHDYRLVGVNAMDAATAYRTLMRQHGYKVADGFLETLTASAQFVSFTFTEPNGYKGETIAMYLPGVKMTFILLGRWPAEHDAQAGADMERLAQEMDVTAYRH